ncbi:hypothetical protein SKAU_G00401220 [Synaphobranchus kaupii]|uniref:Serum response factor-binding protein 1 n=1 Tax=Synaphobranchus kaupii TaxID=118154 RepID=A0A9Q1IAD7_SYNKA|nr:hypothetical protein SKAU_G00401220 [Synaphobranchus kaupii]
MKPKSRPTVKMAEVLNLNNEVVRMRKVVKTARVLIIRKLARHIVSLKKRKGNEAEVEKNQRRAARLLEEIHEMKSLKPDHVTKAALMKDLNFENVCKNPSSTLSERATARLATHPQISKKIQEIKAAIKAFKDERRTPAEGKASKPGKPAEQPKMDAIKSDKEEEEEDGSDHGADDDADDDDDDDDNDGGVCPDDGDVEDEGEEKEEGVGAAMDGSSPAKEEPTVKTGDDIIETASKSELRGPSEEVEMQPEEKPETLIKQQKAVDPAHKSDDSKTQPTQDKKTQKPTENKPPPQCLSNSRVEIKGPRAKGEEEEEEEEESDLDSSDDDEEEKEYFDDSTEERFRKQSSQSEGSDEDDFFLGKVSKFKKRKTGPGVAGKSNSDRNVSRANALEAEAEGQCGDEGRGQKNSKAAKLESVFCTTLSGSRGAHGNRGRGPSGISKPHGFQNERRGQGRTQKPAPFQNRGGSQDGKSTASKFQNQKRGGFRGGPRVQGRGPGAVRARPQFENPRDHRAAAGRASNPSQHAQQALHPSWEASKRRREQQAQITAFQGKKIKFDDD